MNQSLQDTTKRFLTIFTAFLIILSVFLVVLILKGWLTPKSYDTISVSADAETFASPDIAEVNFTIRAEDKEVSVAQKDVESKLSPIMESLSEIGIEEKDIKTTYYNANPRYEYGREACLVYRCDSGQRALVGYEVSQSVNITIRELDKVGDVLASLGSGSASDIHGPNFRIENEDDIKDGVREEAIKKAREKGKNLAKSLGVRIVGIESFNEGYGGGIYYARNEMMAMDGAVTASAPQANFSPTLPQGENKVTSNVTIVYRVR
jgi:uncharacterized protein YggE